MQLLPSMSIMLNLAKMVTNIDITRPSSMFILLKSTKNSKLEFVSHILKVYNGFSRITILAVRAGSGFIHSIMLHLQQILSNVIKLSSISF